MMKNIKEILKGVDYIKAVNQDDSLNIEGIAFDSRNVKKNYVFVAEKGELTDGHLYIKSAVENGASVVVLQNQEYVDYSCKVMFLIVDNPSLVLAKLADNWFDSPSRKLKLVGITGTNGKTTTVTLLYELFTSLGFKCGKLSTVENIVDRQVFKTDRTTPDVLTVNSLLKMMVEQGCQYAFMEVSSHAVVQNRVAYLQFAGGIFSNITLDHLDYHKTFANYISAKKRFFDILPKDAFALTNKDDKNGSVMLQNTVAGRYTYGLQSAGVDFKARILESSLEGLDLLIDNKEVLVQLCGKFNAYNILAVYSCAVLLGMDKQEILTAITLLQPAKGRFEKYRLGTGAYAIIDYAHTPDALENVLQTVKDCNNDKSRIITVVGCGGNRDKSKRPIMGSIAQKMSDILIITNDNPRNEDPETIVNEIKQGLDSERNCQVYTLLDRKEAIQLACNISKQGDIVLVAGKGHETYQEIKGVKHHFDDKEEILRYTDK